MADAVIRPAKRDDLPDLVRIYNHYVTSSNVTFDVTAFSIADRVSWFEGFSSTGPHRLLVAEAASRPVGYASSKEFRPKPAYSTSVETTIYLDPEWVGQGIGRALYTTLIEILKEQGLHRAYGGIALPNPGSVALHESLGFKLVGTLREVGRKFDKFWDVSWYELALAGRGPLGSRESPRA